MDTYLIERRWGPLAPADLEAAAERSTTTMAAQFGGQLAWVRSHLIETPDGLVSYCVYEADDAASIRSHADAAEIPCDVVTQTEVIGPAEEASQ